MLSARPAHGVTEPVVTEFKYLHRKGVRAIQVSRGYLDMRGLLDPKPNVAVLMQLAGLELWQASAFAGLLLIVVGGLMHRRELRRMKTHAKGRA